MNKLQRGLFLLAAVWLLALLPGTALAEPEGRIPDFTLELRDTPAATGDSLILIVESENGRIKKAPPRAKPLP